MRTPAGRAKADGEMFYAQVYRRGFPPSYAYHYAALRWVKS